MVEGGLGAAAVVLAACVEVSSPSPGNSRTVWELREEGALIETALPLEGPVVMTAPLTVGLVVVVDVVDPVVVVDDDAAENVDVEDNGDAGAPRESGPPEVLPLFVWLAAVWACAAVIPRKMIAIRIVRCIAFSSLAMQDNARSIEKENEV